MNGNLMAAIKSIFITSLVVSLVISSLLPIQAKQTMNKEVAPLTTGPYSVAMTNMEIADEFADITDDEMHTLLIGSHDASSAHNYIASILKYPNSAFITQVKIPDLPEVYLHTHGKTYPVVSYVAYPSVKKQDSNTYSFPYHNAQYGKFENMLSDKELPEISNTKETYPVVILSHGGNAHGIYEVGHAQKIASHGYIVVSITYGDYRAKTGDEIAYLRPLFTQAVLDDLLDHKQFGPRIDKKNIGMSGFSFGGLTSLAISGGRLKNSKYSVVDERISAVVATAPWVGDITEHGTYDLFGDNNHTLGNINVPVIMMFGTNDTAVTSSSVLAASQLVSGPTYVVELVDQEHNLEEGSWFDRDGWELLFLSAYLQHDQEALDKLKHAVSMEGGNIDRQLFKYQRNITR
jgi:dienelactone hydrolase